MIRSKRELNFTRKRMADFAKAITEFDLSHPPAGIQAEAHHAAYDALVGLHAQLCREVNQYERLFTEGIAAIRVESLADIPSSLIQARIARRLTQASLAHRLGVKPQQVQRWESQNYENAEFATILDVASALGLMDCFRRPAVEVGQGAFAAIPNHYWEQTKALPRLGGSPDQTILATLGNLVGGVVSLSVETAKNFSLTAAQSVQDDVTLWTTMFGSSVASITTPRSASIFVETKQARGFVDAQNDLQAENLRLKAELVRAKAELSLQHHSRSLLAMHQQQPGINPISMQPITVERTLGSQTGFGELVQ